MMKEMMGVHTNDIFKPIKWDTMTYQQKRMALRAIIFMKQKRCARIKTRLCADGRPQIHHRLCVITGAQHRR